MVLSTVSDFIYVCSFSEQPVINISQYGVLSLLCEQQGAQWIMIMTEFLMNECEYAQFGKHAFD